jgi:hypothetical protein
MKVTPTPQPAESSSHPHAPFPSDHFNIIRPPMQRSLQNLQLNFYTFPLRAICPVHLSLDLDPLTILHNECILRRSSLCNFIDPPVTPSLIVPTTLLSLLLGHF